MKWDWLKDRVTVFAAQTQSHGVILHTGYIIASMPQSSKQTNIYLQRLNIVINHIRENSTEDLSLSELAQVAGFSPFHFHRLFKSLTDETVSDMASRFRLERAASLLRASPGLSITDAAFECGFRSVSVFSRTFKKHYGMNARDWDRQSPLKNSKNGKASDDFPAILSRN